MSALRNILIVGGVVIGGALAYRFARQRFFSGDVQQDYAPPKPAAPRPGSVVADQLVTVRTGTAITKREKGMQYFPILSTRSVGGTIERSFRPTIDGYYTGRILNQSKKLYAEVQPVSSSTLSGIAEDIIHPSANAIDTLQRLLYSSHGMRSGKGQRQAMARQIRQAQRAVRSTPEWRVLAAKCKAKVNELQAPLDAMNVGNIRWESNPDILTGNCRITFESYEPGGGGGD